MGAFLLQWVGMPLICLTIGFGAGWRVHDWKDASGQVQAVVKVARVIEKQGAINTVAAQKEQAAQDRIVLVTKTIVEKVPTYVTPEADARCVIPVGFLRLHDAAAAGLPPVSEATGKPDDAPSGVELHTVTETVVGNYGVANSNAEKLGALQEWLRQQAAVRGMTIQ
jgi:hypothetical protein